MDTLNYLLKKYNLRPATKIEIPNVGRDDLANLLNELNFKIGVEIGVQRGIYSESLCRANPQMKIYGVDPWISAETEQGNPADKRTENSTSQKTCDRLYREAVNRLKVYPKYHILKEYSVDAVKRFEDESLDFVYIDGNHQDDFVVQDIEVWSKKVRLGGIVSGHDYYNTIESAKGQLHIENVVNKYVTEHNITPLIIWGLKDKTPGIIRDKWRSWMWVKA